MIDYFYAYALENGPYPYFMADYTATTLCIKLINTNINKHKYYPLHVRPQRTHSLTHSLTQLVS